MQRTTMFTKFYQSMPERRGMNFAARRMAYCAMQSQQPSTRAYGQRIFQTRFLNGANPDADSAFSFVQEKSL